MAFEISARNQARGEAPISIRAFVDLVFRDVLPPSQKEDHGDALQPKGSRDTPLTPS